MLINHPSNHKIDLKEILCQVRILTTQINELGQNLNLTVNEIRTALASDECSTLEVTCLNLIAAELETALEKVQICRTQVTYKSLQLHPDLPNLTPQAKRRWKLKKKTLLNIAIQKSELYQQLQQANLQLENLVMVDQLTQIPNRRFFDQQLDQI